MANGTLQMANGEFQAGFLLNSIISTYYPGKEVPHAAAY
jgi:hypothetical protein